MHAVKMSPTQHIPRRLPVDPIARSLHSVPAPAAARPVRLTRRGRVVVLLTLLMLLLVAFTLGRAGTSEAAGPRQSQPVVYEQTTVHQGESLWSVARRIAPDRDPRAVVLQLRELNKLTNGSVQAGQQLILPR